MYRKNYITCIINCDMIHRHLTNEKITNSIFKKLTCQIHRISPNLQNNLPYRGVYCHHCQESILL